MGSSTGGGTPLNIISRGAFGKDFGSTTTAPAVKEFDALTAEQQALLKKLSGELTGQIGQGVDVGPGALQTQGFDAVQQMLSGGAPGAGDAQSALQRIMGYDPSTRRAETGGLTQTRTGDIMGPTAGGRGGDAMEHWQKSFVDPAMDLWGDIKGKTMEPFAAMGGMRSGEAMRAMGRAGKEFTTGLTGQLSDLLYKQQESEAGRTFAGQESFAGRAQTAEEAGLGREFGAGESWASRLMGTSESEIGREFAGGESNIARMLQIPGMSGQMTQTGAMPIQQALQAGGTQFDIGQMGEAWNNPWLQQLETTLGTSPFERIGLPGSKQPGSWGQLWGK